jgi:hypothetical protein
MLEEINNYTEMHGEYKVKSQALLVTSKARQANTHPRHSPVIGASKTDKTT